jgi:hypothetical protein
VSPSDNTDGDLPTSLLANRREAHKFAPAPVTFRRHLRTRLEEMGLAVRDIELYALARPGAAQRSIQVHITLGKSTGLGALFTSECLLVEEMRASFNEVPERIFWRYEPALSGTPA